MLNKVILIGRIANDPELKYTPSAVAVVSFRLAVNRPFKNSAGDYEADFIDVVAWRQAAEFLATHCGKGRLIAVEGRIQVRSYETQDGQRRRVTEVVAENVKGLDRRRDDGERGASHSEEDAPPDYTDPFEFA